MIYSAPTTRRNQNCANNPAENRNSEKAGSLESGSRFEPARLRRPRLAPRPAPRRRDKPTQYGPNGRAGERGAAPPPAQLRTPTTNAPPTFPGEAAFRRIPAPLECAGHRALFDRGTISSKKGVLPVPGPPNGFYFRFPKKTMGPVGPSAGRGRRTVADTQCRRHPLAKHPNHRHFRRKTSVHPPWGGGWHLCQFYGASSRFIEVELELGLGSA